MSKLALAFSVLLGLHSCCCISQVTSDILSEALDNSLTDQQQSQQQQNTQQQQQQQQQQKQQERSLEYALKRSLFLPNDLLLQPYDSRERRSGSSSFIRFGRSDAGTAINAPHTRSDIIIRYGRDGINNRLARLRQERMRKLARLSLICAAKNLDDLPANSAEEKIIKDMCRDAPLHPTVPDFV